MDPNATRPILAGKVHYRCTCGTELQLDPQAGGPCANCSKVISPKVLAYDTSMTTTLQEGSFVLNQPGVSLLGEDGKMGVTLFGGRSPSVDRVGEADDFDDDSEILLGKRYGHFEIIALLGRGGMGQVYRALDTSLQRYVAVKLLRSDRSKASGSPRTSSHSDRSVDKLLQEAVSQARVAHPNIVTIYYVGKQDDDPFLAMELVNGRPLSVRIADGDIAFSEIASVAVQICDALEFSYELDLIHGDIKPSNMLLQHNGIAKLSDFGMARRVSGDAYASVGGTPNYIAPELLKGEPPSLQSDVYALGVTLYEMSFGKLPVVLTGNSIAQWNTTLDSSDLTFPQPWPDRFPESWRGLLSKMLAKNPADRYESYGLLQADLKRLTPHSQVIARPFPRIVAAGLDWIVVLLLAIFLQFSIRFTSWLPGGMAWWGVGAFLPIVTYTTIVYFWRQSLGRSLMHIRVVNRYGLRPQRMRMVVRSLMRNPFPWFAAVLSLFDDPTKSWAGVVTLVLVGLSALFLLIDFAFVAFYPKRKSIHDLIVGTQVVIDLGE